MSELGEDIQIILGSVNLTADQLLESSAMVLAFGDGKRWQSLTGWQRDKYRRQARRLAKKAGV